jgi:predicted glycosyltransferase
VAMGGYNTVTEVLSYKKHALIVPRVEPRLEQLVRAERLRDLGLLDVLHPDLLDPRTLSAWLRHDPATAVRNRGHVDLNGLERLPLYLDELLDSDPVSSSWTSGDALALAL